MRVLIVAFYFVTALEHRNTNPISQADSSGAHSGGMREEEHISEPVLELLTPQNLEGGTGRQNTKSSQVSGDEGMTSGHWRVANGTRQKEEAAGGCIDRNGVLEFTAGLMPAQTNITGRLDWEHERALCLHRSSSDFLTMVATDDACVGTERSLPPLQVGKSARRVLVIMLCSTRANKLTWDSLKKNVLDPLGADLALSVSVTGGSSSATRDDQLRQNAKFIWEVKDPPQNDYGYHYKEVAKTCGHPDVDMGRFNCINTFGGIHGQRGSGAMLWYFRYVALQGVVHHPNEMQGYTHFVLTRSDYNYTAPHPLLLLDSALMIPDGEDYGGITDRHTVVPRELFPVATGMLFEMLTRSNGTWCDRANPEALLKRWYKDKGLKIRRFPRTMYAVTSKSTQQAAHWSRGTAHPDFTGNILLKYPREYESAKRNAEELRKCNEQPGKACLEKFASWQIQH